MLKGKALGDAIKYAIEKKLDRRLAPSKAAIAKHFGVKPPSIHDWIKKGSISKDKLPELWRYFSDVVGPEHWGLAGQPFGGIEQKRAEYAPDISEDEQWLIFAYRAADKHVRKAMMALARSVLPDRPMGLGRRTGT